MIQRFKKSRRLRFLNVFCKKTLSYLRFLSDFREFKILSKGKTRFKSKWVDRYPQLMDNTAHTSFDRHYIYHPAWAARIIKKINPEKHVDLSSTLHFCSLLSAFIPVDFYDYRPADLKLSNLKSLSADLLKLPFKDNSIDSLSCMHTVEHVGLGRYGDPLDSEGDLKAIEELKRVLAKGGSLLFVVPIGWKPKIMFNAHRIYSYEQIVGYFKDLKLMEFSLISEKFEDGGIIKNPSKEILKKQKYACGCFWFKKV